jgi:phospholipid transport system substrate-binding protein
MKKAINLITAFLIILYLQAVQATTGQEPLDLIQSTTQRLVAALDQKPELRTSPDGLHKLVEDIVLPHVDLAGLSRLTLGKYWHEATLQQRERFVEQFRWLLVRTYSKSLVESKNQGVEYELLTTSEDVNKSIVRALIERPGQPVMQVDYRMRRIGSGWKIYDVAIEGISLAVSYRRTFSDEIRRNRP